jgi:hypothetical protein
MIEYEYYDWNNLITPDARFNMCKGIMELIDKGHYWKNSPPYQTDVNVMGLPGEHWTNLKMSFIYSCFAFMKQERQIKSIKSWGYQTSLKKEENRDRYWHQHIRENSLVVSGVYYLHMPDDIDLKTAGTEFAPNGVEGDGKFFAEAKVGNWIIFPGKSWHRPGILQSKDDRYIIAADMEI